ncbi:hypothetical protein PanWU01x14_094670 [Parasponia andersonii]|uniref:Uncharacterized protein n=1 Tax=Parasponia andersonii TaxID=3476 RepID=A0A2P5D5G7_PARAD|nr:hypothetical protein PanWU01x14_094670 [Parasponia andersonii]
MRSTPEKVFEYFASVRTLAGEVFMTPADLMRATVPVPVFTPSESNRIIEIDREEFNKVMALMRAQNRQGARYKDGRLGQKAVSVENGGLLEYFFGKDGKTCLRHETFVQFLTDLHNEVNNSLSTKIFGERH